MNIFRIYQGKTFVLIFISIKLLSCIAQLVERWSNKPKVVRSSRTGRTFKNLLFVFVSVQFENYFSLNNDKGIHANVI